MSSCFVKYSVKLRVHDKTLIYDVLCSQVLMTQLVLILNTVALG